MDDLWLKTMALLKGTKAAICKEGSQIYFDMTGTRTILQQLQAGEISIDEAESYFNRAPFEEMEYAKLDTIVTMMEKSMPSLHPQGVPPRLGAGWCSWLKVRSGVLW